MNSSPSPVPEMPDISMNSSTKSSSSSSSSDSSSSMVGDCRVRDLVGYVPELFKDGFLSKYTIGGWPSDYIFTMPTKEVYDKLKDRGS